VTWPKEGRRKEKKERKKRKEEKKKEKRKKRKEKEKRKRKGNRKMGKEIRKSFRKIRRISREIRGRVFAGFSGQRDFRDGGDGEADRPAGPWRARDSRHGGRPRCWGGTRWAMPRVRAVPAGFAAHAPKGRERTAGVSKGGK
jgi:hypothetical protein